MQNFYLKPKKGIRLKLYRLATKLDFCFGKHTQNACVCVLNRILLFEKVEKPILQPLDSDTPSVVNVIKLNELPLISSLSSSLGTCQL